MENSRTTSPLALYHHALEQGQYQADEVQRQAMTVLEHIQRQLIAAQTQTDSSATGFFTRIQQWIGAKSVPTVTPVTGLYMWGGVGRGKTWLMDLFFQSVPGSRKLRLHFHRFMLRVHQQLTELQGQRDPLLIIADRFKAQTDLLCFDEFFVSDITDAMLLGNLMEALFERGITLIATSNIPPEQLYRNGLQRERFIPAIKQIQQHCQVLNVDAGIDYRLRALSSAHLWKSPLNSETTKQIVALFKQLAGRDFREGSAQALTINHRSMSVLDQSDGVLVIDFHVLCTENRSQLDYIALSRQFHTVFLLNVIQLTTGTEDQARRFLALIDEFYERQVKLIVTAQCDFLSIYQGNQLAFEYQRCLSRLQEMQSEDYLHRPHLP